MSSETLAAALPGEGASLLFPSGPLCGDSRRAGGEPSPGPQSRESLEAFVRSRKMEYEKMLKENPANRLVRKRLVAVLRAYGARNAASEEGPGWSGEDKAAG